MLEIIFLFPLLDGFVIIKYNSRCCWVGGRRLFFVGGIARETRRWEPAVTYSLT